VIYPSGVEAGIVTVDETRRYALTALAAYLTDARQVTRVWIEDEDEDEKAHFEIGRWWIEQSGSTFFLVLGEDPVDAGRTIRIEYMRRPTALLFGTEPTYTNLDPEWVTAKAMTLLLLEAEPERPGEDLNSLMQQIQMWDLKRMAREQATGRRTPSRQMRTTAWRQYR
jgi:hypothetical protein